MADTVTDTFIVGIIRYTLAGFFLFVAAFYTVRILTMRKRLGTSPVVANIQDPAQRLTHLCFRVMRVLILSVCVARVIEPGLDQYLGIYEFLWHDAVMLVGLVVLVAGFGWTMYVHFQMKAGWRSGVDPQAMTPLITDGIFAKSRNPAMLGVQLAQLGFFLALPSVFSFACLVIGIAAVQVQVRIEERMLSHAYGSDYKTYSESTPRWM